MFFWGHPENPFLLGLRHRDIAYFNVFLVTSANSVFIVLLSTLLKSKTLVISRVIMSEKNIFSGVRYLPISKMFDRTYFSVIIVKLRKHETLGAIGTMCPASSASKIHHHFS